MMRRPPTLIGLTLAAVLAAGGVARADTTICTLTFSLGGWSKHFEQSVGKGTITCDNGQSAPVAVGGSGATLADGAGAIARGQATFSPVLIIPALLGSYALPPAARFNKRSGGVSEALSNGQATLTFPLSGPSSKIPGTFGRFVVRAR